MKRKRKRRRKSIRRFAVLLGVCMILFAALALTVENKKRDTQPEEVLVSYMQKLGEADYAGMYSMLSEDSRRRISREEFVQKHENIYGGIEAEGFQVEITDINKENAGVPRISYDMEFTTLAGSINFKNQAVLTREKRLSGRMGTVSDFSASDRFRYGESYASEGPARQYPGPGRQSAGGTGNRIQCGRDSGQAGRRKGG